MIFSIGIDLVENARIERIFSLYAERFLDRVLSTEEKEVFLCSPSIEKLAGYFAIKEATYKALRPEDVPLRFKEILLRQEKGGAPTVALQGSLQRLAKIKGISALHVSLSHEKSMTVAVVLAVTNKV